ncbi:MAG: leucine-rich repeat domain-containing protein [Ruminococcaceae bacterium]|nr:leucine-rich repeat domain-containing protein [Oscillospiraceae bacterium]
MKNKLFTALAVLFALSLAACNIGDDGDTTTDTTALPDVSTVESTVQTETQSETEVETTTETAAATETETTAETETVTETEEATTVHTHLYGEWAVMTKPTCTKGGKMVRECECGDKEVEPLDELGHTEVLLEAVAPTCTKTGLSEGKRCATCKKTLVKQTVLPVLHDYVDNACSKCGEPTPSEGLKYTYNSNTDSYTVTNIGTCTDAHIVISGSYNGKPVTGIDEFAFWNEEFTSVTIGNGIKIIGEGAFESCINLTDVTISQTVQHIGEYPFSSCENLESVSVSHANDYYYSDDNCIVELQTSKLILGNKNGIIPEGVKVIGEQAFFGCTGLKSLTIPDHVTKIPAAAFIGCSGIESLSVSPDNPYYYSSGNCIIEKNTNVLIRGCQNSIIPYGVTAIGPRAFSDCIGLTEITIPNSVTSIGDRAFSFCSLKSITIPGSILQIGEYAFDLCRMTSVTFEHPTTWKVTGFDENCDEINGVTVPSLNDPEQAAKYLQDIYFACKWTHIWTIG